MLNKILRIDLLTGPRRLLSLALAGLRARELSIPESLEDIRLPREHRGQHARFSKMGECVHLSLRFYFLDIKNIDGLVVCL